MSLTKLILYSIVSTIVVVTLVSYFYFGISFGKDEAVTIGKIDINKNNYDSITNLAVSKGWDTIMICDVHSQECVYAKVGMK